MYNDSTKVKAKAVDSSNEPVELISRYIVELRSQMGVQIVYYGVCFVLFFAFYFFVPFSFGVFHSLLLLL